MHFEPGQYVHVILDDEGQTWFVRLYPQVHEAIMIEGAPYWDSTPEEDEDVLNELLAPHGLVAVPVLDMNNQERDGLFLVQRKH